MLSVISGPTAEPVSLEMAKLHLRVDSDEEDALIDGLIVAARQQCEDWARWAFVDRTVEWVLDSWPAGDWLKLPLGPVRSITSITYTTAAGAAQTMPAGDYELLAAQGRVYLAEGAAWPTADLKTWTGVRVRYVAGYGTAADVPARYRQAMLLCIGHWYENRETVVLNVPAYELPMAAKSLLLTDRGY